MKERLTTVVLALGALVFFYAFLFPKPAPERAAEDLPLSTGKYDHGYRGIRRWLETERTPVKVLHLPYTELSKLASAQGNVLITTVPHRVQPRRDEADALKAWVSSGNTLLVMAALDDTPPWSSGSDPSFLQSLTRMTSIDFDAIRETSEGSAHVAGSRSKRLLDSLRREPLRIGITPHGASPLFAGVNSVLAISELPASHWRATAEDDSALLQIGDRAPPAGSRAQESAFWLRRLGEGQILVAGFSSIFDNQLIGERDNARLFANIVKWSIGIHGSVIFDDDHQGVTEYYDAKAFFRDPRLHRTLYWVLGLWFLFVLGWQSLRPVEDAWRPMDITTFIGTTGQFFASALTPASVANRLFDNFFNAIRRRVSLPADGEPVWEWLEANARVGNAALDELKELYARTQGGKRVDLVRLQNILSQLSGSME